MKVERLGWYRTGRTSHHKWCVQLLEEEVSCRAGVDWRHDSFDCLTSAAARLQSRYQREERRVAEESDLGGEACDQSEEASLVLEMMGQAAFLAMEVELIESRHWQQLGLPGL